MKKTILWIGASGNVASIVIPELAKKYDVVGVARSRGDLAPHCIAFFKANLLEEAGHVLPTLFNRYSFDAVVWNVVNYFRLPLIEASRNSMVMEYDLGVALPLACVRTYIEAKQPEKKRFIIVSSQSAFGHSMNLGSYSIVKRGQLMLMDYLSIENPGVAFRALALGAVPKISHTRLVESFVKAIEAQEEIVVRVEQDLQ